MTSAAECVSVTSVVGYRATLLRLGARAVSAVVNRKCSACGLCIRVGRVTSICFGKTVSCRRWYDVGTCPYILWSNRPWFVSAPCGGCFRGACWSLRSVARWIYADTGVKLVPSCVVQGGGRVHTLTRCLPATPSHARRACVRRGGETDVARSWCAVQGCRYGAASVM